MYPFRWANVPLGVHVPQVGNPWFRPVVFNVESRPPEWSCTIFLEGCKYNNFWGGCKFHVHSCITFGLFEFSMGVFGL